MIEVVNRSGYNGESYYVGRPSPLGNPYTHVGSRHAEYRVATRDEAVDKYESWLKEKLGSDNEISREFWSLVEFYKDFGRLVLSCWCAPKRCHADVIARMIKEHVDAGTSLQEYQEQSQAMEEEGCCEDVQEEDAGGERVVGCSEG